MSELPFIDALETTIERHALRDERRRRPLRQRTGRVRTLLVAATALACAALAGVALIPGDGVRPIAEQAYGAMAPDGEIVHSIRDITIHEGDELELHQRFEEWWDGSTKRSLGATIDDGRAIPSTERVTRGDTSRIYLVRSNELIREQSTSIGGQRQDDPIAIFRQLYRRGAIKHAGTTTVDGRRLERLVQRAGAETRTWLVAPRTSTPVEYRLTIDRAGTPPFRYTVRFLAYERLARTAKNRRLLRMRHHPGATITQRNVKPTDPDAR